MDLNYSLLKRFGNKKWLLQKVDFTKFFPEVDRTGIFLDLFCGTGAVSWYYLDRMKRRGRPVQTKLNDKDARLIRFFEYLQNHRREFEAALKFRWAGSERIMRRPFTELDDVVHYYLKNQESTEFRKAIKLYKDFSKFAEILDYHKVRFMCKDWEGALTNVAYYFSRMRVRNSNTVIYCDPPYDATCGYASAFDIDEFLDAIKELDKKAKSEGLQDHFFVFISLNKTDRVADALSEWYSLELNEYCKRVLRKKRTEMLYSNKPIQKRSELVNSKIERFIKE